MLELDGVKYEGYFLNDKYHGEGKLKIEGKCEF
jgi:hypothetical protein